MTKHSYMAAFWEHFSLPQLPAEATCASWVISKLSVLFYATRSCCWQTAPTTVAHAVSVETHLELALDFPQKVQACMATAHVLTERHILQLLSKESLMTELTLLAGWGTGLRFLEKRQQCHSHHTFMATDIRLTDKLASEADPDAAKPQKMIAMEREKGLVPRCHSVIRQFTPVTAALR